MVVVNVGNERINKLRGGLSSLNGDSFGGDGIL